MTEATGVESAAYAQASRAMANLRGVFIIILVAFHATLAYLGSTPAPSAAFDQPPFLWLAFPIVDERRFFGFDLYCAWEDVHVMAMMYFLSGLFAAPSLRRKGASRFAAERLQRLGLPFLFNALVLMPAAIYPVYARLHPQASVADYLAAYRNLPFLPNGPTWFLWLLIAFSFAAALLYRLAPPTFGVLTELGLDARRRPRRFFLTLAGAATLAYLPLTLSYGPFDWFERGLFSFQISRPLLYGVFFFVGVAVGAAGLGDGLLAPDSALSRHWRRLIALSLSSLFLWMGITGVTIGFPDFAPLAMRTLSALAYVAASVSGVMCLLGVAIRFCAQRIPWLEPLSRNSLGIFVLHYVLVVWMQYELTALPLPALVKGLIVFAVVLPISLGLAAAMRTRVFSAWLIGEDGARLTPSPATSRRP